MPTAERRRYTLADYSVERRDRGWYFAHPYDPVGAYRGPYRSIASVTLVIARQLRREIERRDQAASLHAKAVSIAAPAASVSE